MQVVVMKEELTIADIDAMERGKILDDKNVEIAQKSAELAISDLNLMHANSTIRKTQNTLASTHSFAILRINDEDAHGTHYAMLRKRPDMQTAIKKMSKKFPRSTVMFLQKYAPQNFDIYRRLKHDGIVISQRNFFKLATCEHDLVRRMDGMYVNYLSSPTVNF